MESLNATCTARHIGTTEPVHHSIMDEKFKAYGFQRGQFIFFTRICETPGLTLTDLTLQCAVDKATTTKAVDKLAAAGYVEKRRDIRDGRAWNVYPAEKGLAIYDEFIAEEKPAGRGLSGRTPGAEDKAAALRLAAVMSRNAADEWSRMKR